MHFKKYVQRIFNENEKMSIYLLKIRIIKKLIELFYHVEMVAEADIFNIVSITSLFVVRVKVLYINTL